MKDLGERPEKNIEIVWMDIPISTIVSYWIKGYTEKVWNDTYEYFIDVAKGKVVLKVYVERGEAK